mmetsp:Transcript_8024/g.23590  ORF Transcript_8024/g.23590 Transcript_8024/m.23590 type:complete len:288 (+) Transcript_8024:779-1642(+)
MAPSSQRCSWSPRGKACNRSARRCWSRSSSCQPRTAAAPPRQQRSSCPPRTACTPSRRSRPGTCRRRRACTRPAWARSCTTPWRTASAAWSRCWRSGPAWRRCTRSRRRGRSCWSTTRRGRGAAHLFPRDNSGQPCKAASARSLPWGSGGGVDRGRRTCCSIGIRGRPSRGCQQSRQMGSPVLQAAGAAGRGSGQGGGGRSSSCKAAQRWRSGSTIHKEARGWSHNRRGALGKPPAAASLAGERTPRDTPRNVRLGASGPETRGGRRPLRQPAGRGSAPLHLERCSR